MIGTERLELIPASIEMLESELNGIRALRQLIDAEVPESWPPELYDEDAIRWSIGAMSSDPSHADWYFHYFVERATAASPRRLVGAGGYKGPPEDGAVEIGYSIIPEHRRQGFASEATRGLVRRAFEQPGVNRIVAHTLPDLHPSIAVLHSCGFELVGAGDDPGTIRYQLVR